MENVWTMYGYPWMENEWNMYVIHLRTMYVIHQCITWMKDKWNEKWNTSMEDFIALHRSFLRIHTSSINVIHRWKMYGTINGIHQTMIFVPLVEDVCITSMEYFYREYLPSMEDQNMKKKKKCFIFHNFFNNSSDAVSCGLSQYNWW